jgi:hypothetical protein
MPKSTLKALKHYLEGINTDQVTPQKAKNAWMPWHGDGKSQSSQGGLVFHTRSIESNGEYITKVSPKGKADPIYISYTSNTWGASPAKTVIAAMLKALEK